MVEIRLHTEFQLVMLLRSGSFLVGDKQKTKNSISIDLIATLAPARTEIEAGVVANADQNCLACEICTLDT